MWKQQKPLLSATKKKNAADQRKSEDATTRTKRKCSQRPRRTTKMKNGNGWASGLACILLSVPQGINHGGICQGTGVTNIFDICRNLSQNSSHDFAGSRFGQARSTMYAVGSSKRADLFADLRFHVLCDVGIEFDPLAGDDVAIDGFSLDVVRDCHCGGFDHVLVPGKRCFNLGRSDPMPGHVDDVIDASCDPKVPVLIASCTIARAVVPLVKSEVRLFKSCVVAEQRSHLPWPRLLNGQISRSCSLQFVTIIVEEHRDNAQHGERGGSRLHWCGARHARDAVPARFRLPPCVHDGAFLVSNDVVVPQPRFRVDGFSHCAKHSKGGQIVLVRELIPESLECTDGGWSRVELIDFVLLADFPEAPSVWIGWNSLEKYRCCAVEQRTIGDVGVSRDPANVCRAPVDVSGMVVERVLGGRVRPHHVPTRGVQHTLGLARGSAGEEEEQWVLRVHPFHRAVSTFGIFSLKEGAIN
eukprot:m.321197 g.321197  ORF g.321197 m.321197 type:complete len:471 (-) comp20329_c0_seq3:1019-2431(-)